jgi:hypothetical protein
MLGLSDSALLMVMLVQPYLNGTEQRIVSVSSYYRYLGEFGKVSAKVGVKRAGTSPGPFRRLCVCPANERFPKRRRRDSNPRYPV